MRYLYWYKDQIHETDAQPAILPYVDRGFKECYVRARYGHWGEDAVWVHVPLESFPKGFQMALILLGIT